MLRAGSIHKSVYFVNCEQLLLKYAVVEPYDASVRALDEQFGEARNGELASRVRWCEALEECNEQAKHEYGAYGDGRTVLGRQHGAVEDGCALAGAFERFARYYSLVVVACLEQRNEHRVECAFYRGNGGVDVEEGQCESGVVGRRVHGLAHEL